LGGRCQQALLLCTIEPGDKILARQQGAGVVGGCGCVGLAHDAVLPVGRKGACWCCDGVAQACRAVFASAVVQGHAGCACSWSTMVAAGGYSSSCAPIYRASS